MVGVSAVASPGEMGSMVGAAIQDLTVAAICVERARELGIGTEIPAPIQPVDKGK